MEERCKAKWLVFTGEGCGKVSVWVYGKTRTEYDAIKLKHWLRIIDRVRRLYPVNSESMLRSCRIHHE